MEKEEKEFTQEDQELLMNASMLENQSRELEANLEIIDREIVDLEKFLEGINHLSKSKSNEILASLGKGVYVKSSINESKLYVNVGQGIIVKKTPESTAKVIENQIQRLTEVRAQILQQLEIFTKNFSQVLKELEKLKHKTK